MTPHGKHRPRSHPALRRVFLEQQTVDPDVTAKVEQGIDDLAGRVARLPDYPDLLTVGQRERLRIIGRELIRRARL